MSVQISDNARYALITYYNYIKAWIIYIDRLYGLGDDGIKAFIDKTKSLTAFSRIQGGASSPTKLINSYNRGRLTLSAMQSLPIDNYPELALSANLWLPVQSYYAIHGVGLASLIALNKTPPRDHRTFCANFSELAGKYFPPPFCGRCVAGSEVKDFLFPGLCTSATKVAKQSNLANPAFAEGDDFIGKTLSSTRKKILKELFDKKRGERVKRGRKRRNLPYEEKQASCRKEHATSICDFIYRMRVRSNYDNPDMYLFASHNPEDAANHYRNLLYLTKIIIAGLDTLIERKIGRTEMAKLKSKFEQQPTS